MAWRTLTHFDFLGGGATQLLELTKQMTFRCLYQGNSYILDLYAHELMLQSHPQGLRLNTWVLRWGLVSRA